MKRRVRQIAVLVLVGVIINIAVAWGLAMRPHDPNIWLTSEHACHREVDGVADWDLWYETSPGRRYIRSIWVDEGCGGGFSGICDGNKLIALLPRWAHGADARRVQPAQATHQVHITAFGWPLPMAWSAVERTVWCEWPRTRQDGYDEYGLRARIAPLHHVFGGPISALLPTHPIWSGMIINSVMYAALIWLLFASMTMIRRQSRRRRGRCINCGYPLGESVVCTECGRSHPRSDRAQRRPEAAR